MIEINVDLGDRSYPVLVGYGARHRLTEVLPTGVDRVAVVTQEGLEIPVDPGVPFETFVIDQGEHAKNLETIEVLCRGFAKMELHRNDAVVCVGGGVVSDAAGFAAAVYGRGVKYVNVATTLLAQVDAAIGGKTAVNLPEGKNLVGAIWQPSAVLCDTELVEKLPPREFLSGTGEMAKYHFLGSRVGMDDAGFKDLPLDERIAYCVELKARVVALDERDGDLRNILNYGHTLGHALEIDNDFDLRHGEAVAIGIHFAARLARRLGRISDDRVEEHVEFLRYYGLPIDLPRDVSVDRLIALMRRDKKASGSLGFVLDGVNGVEYLRSVDEQMVRLELEEWRSKS